MHNLHPHHNLNITLQTLAGLNHSSVDLGTLRENPQCNLYAVHIDTFDLQSMNDDVTIMREQGYRIYRSEQGEIFCVSPAHSPAYPKHAGRTVKLIAVPSAWTEITQPLH